MPGIEKSPGQFVFKPVGPAQWPDLEALFGPRGAIGGCWCMWWRLKRSDFDRMKGEPNRQALKQIVDSGDVPGLLAYAAENQSENGPGEAVGWVSVADRQAFPVLDRSPVLKRVDDQPAWSVVCFYIARPYRLQSLSYHLLVAAVDYACSHGARIVEGYPIDPKKADVPDLYAFTGTVGTFRKAGFVEVARRSPYRPIMRYLLEAS